MDVLISGAGVAGPCLAWWLAEAGHRPTVVEVAPRPREGGYVLDFWGRGYDLAERMGLLPRLREVGYQVQNVVMVDSAGRRRAGFGVDVFLRITNGRFVSLPRSELAKALTEAAAERAEFRFGDSVQTIRPVGDGVEVAFEQAPPQRFDLVVGADGIHSRVRDLVWGPEDAYERYLGYRFAAFTLPDYAPRDPDAYLLYNEPGIQVGRFALRDGSTLVLLIWSEERPGPLPASENDGKEDLRRRFDGCGWEVARMLSALDTTHDLYIDQVSQIRLPQWSRGRVALVGDAAAAPSFLAGQGSALAMIAAYVLAGELRGADRPEAALAAYERRLRPFITGKQDAATRFTSTFVPGSRFAIGVRNVVTRFMGIPWVADRAVGRDIRDMIDLPDYFTAG